MTIVITSIALLIFVVLFIAAQNLPDIPADVLLSMSEFFGYLKGLDNYIPVTEIMTLFLLTISIEIVMFGIRVLIFIVNSIKGHPTNFSNRR